MDKTETKLAKKIEKHIKKTLQLKYKVILKSRSTTERMYDLLFVDLKGESYYFFRVYDNGIAIFNHNNKFVTVATSISKALHDFFYA
jgi:hypothetical protein